jgi:hypothetical protein
MVCYCYCNEFFFYFSSNTMISGLPEFVGHTKPWGSSTIGYLYQRCRSVVFCIFSLRHVWCISNVVSLSGLFILDCRSVFSNVHLLPIVCPVYCVTNVSSISGLSILDCSFGFQSRLFPNFKDCFIFLFICPLFYIYFNKYFSQTKWNWWINRSINY